VTEQLHVRLAGKLALERLVRWARGVRSVVSNVHLPILVARFLFVLDPRVVVEFRVLRDIVFRRGGFGALACIGERALNKENIAQEIEAGKRIVTRKRLAQTRKEYRARD